MQWIDREGQVSWLPGLRWYAAFPGIAAQWATQWRDGVPAIRLQLRGQHRPCGQVPRTDFPIIFVSEDPSRPRLYNGGRCGATAVRISAKRAIVLHRLGPIRHIFTSTRAIQLKSRWHPAKTWLNQER